jgi:DUF4097 and DUF4098 domain-containing protein YvlB
MTVDTMERFEELARGAENLYITVRHGDLTLTAAEGARWSLEWSSDKHEIPVVERDENTLRVQQREIEEHLSQHNPPRLNLRLTIPAGIEVVELDTGHGSLDVRGLAGRSRLATGNGALTLRSASGTTNLSSGHGQIIVEKFEGTLTLRTGNGQVRAGRLRGTASLETGHGQIEIRDSHGTLQAQTGSGDVHLTTARGDAVLHSEHGRIEVNDIEGTTEARTSSGDILLKGARGAATLDTNHGKIEVTHSYLPALSARSGTGDIVIQGGSVNALTLTTHAGNVHCATELAPTKHEISSGKGDLTLTAAQGEVLLETRHGRIHVTRVDNMLRARTSNGDIIVLEAVGELDLDTSHGRIEVIEASGNVVAHSGNGDLIVKTAKGEVALQTGHGRIDVGTPQALTIGAKTGNGDINVGVGSLRSARLETNAGKVTCAAELAPGEYGMTSSNGDIALRVPSNAQARVDAQTGHGQIHSDFPMVGVGRSGGASGARMVGSIGEGVPNLVVSARTANGHIRIERGPAHSDLPKSLAPRATVQSAQGVVAPASLTQRSATDQTLDDEPYQPAVGQTVHLNRASAGTADESKPDSNLAILEALARGELNTDEAAEMLWGRS